MKTGIRLSSRRYLTLSMYRNWINNKSSNKRISIKRNDLFLLFLLFLMLSIKEINKKVSKAKFILIIIDLI